MNRRRNRRFFASEGASQAKTYEIAVRFTESTHFSDILHYTFGMAE